MSLLSTLFIQSQELALSEAKKYGVPSPFNVDLSYRVGQRLAEQLGADQEIVAIGTYLMDCMLGVAASESRVPDHIEMSAQKAEQMIIQVGNITIDVKANVLACVREHHGVSQFSTLESEICCNADCYKFASIEGFLGGINHGREMEFSDLLSLYKAKTVEKWGALSLDICKKELQLQYEAIRQLIGSYGQT